ncbi:MAG TPA: site-2 protease family protein [Candidatus Aquilonibacter sp.]|nr:site-2 protease family protein [Candidatus Aquilonibacter sp.]
MKCDGCHLESERTEIFKSVNRFFRSKDLTLCPACFEKKDDKTNVILIWSYLICGLASFPFILYSPTRSVGLLLLNISVFQLFVLFSTVLHELGHAIAGRLAGIRVFGIEIGKGPVVYEFLVARIRWRVRAIAFGGITRGVPFTAHLFRLKELIYVLGGPATNAVLLFLSIKFISLDEVFQSTTFSGFVPMLLLALSNFLLLVFSLWPHMANSTAGKTPNDGLLLWKIWWFDKPKINETLAIRYLREADECRLQKDLIGMKKWIEEGLCFFPHNPHLKISAVGILGLQKKYPEALRAYALLVGRDKKNENLDSLLLNNIAYTCVLMGKPKLLARADACSRIALKLMPWVVHYKGTRGSVLVEQGKYDEGLKLLHDALRNHPEKTGKALDACHIAIAEARRGNLSESRNYFALARKLDPDCTLLEREAILQNASNA